MFLHFLSKPSLQAIGISLLVELQKDNGFPLFLFLFALDRYWNYMFLGN